MSLTFYSKEEALQYKKDKAAEGILVEITQHNDRLTAILKR